MPFSENFAPPPTHTHTHTHTLPLSLRASYDTGQSLFFNEILNFIKKEILAPVFSCEFCENSKNTFFTEHLHLWTTASIFYWTHLGDCF